MFSKIHDTYRIYWNHHQKHACEIWGSLENLQFLTEKCLQRRTFKTGWNFEIFLMFSKIHETYRSYWNHHQKHACEIEQFGEVTIFAGKMPTAPDLQNRMKFWHFLNVLQNSWNLQNLLESPPETCMWNLRPFGEVTIFDGKMPTAPNLQNRMKFRHFLNVLQNSWNLQNLLKSPPETCMWNLRQFGEVTIFDGKMPTAPDLQNRMKFWHFLNVLQNSWNLQKLLESPPETCMWNLRRFGEVTIFDGKMPTAPDLQNRMKFWHFLNVFQNSWHLQNLLKSPPETCMWNLRQFWKLQFLMENADSAGPSKQNKILTFSQCSPKFMKLTEFIGITTRNMHVKFEAVRRSYNFWWKNAYSAGP